MEWWHQVGQDEPVSSFQALRKLSGSETKKKLTTIDVIRDDDGRKSL